MPSFSPKNPVAVERTVAGLCYLSGGLIGLLYIIISRSRSQSMFFRFHFLQSMILVALGILINLTVGIMQNIVGGMLGLLNLGSPGVVLSYITLGIQLIVNAGFLLMIYGMIMAFLGKYAEIPVISPLVRQNMR
ncbi:MAG: hypothetical protein U0103_03215 [Candidatus Obscuribacterales bacterium]|jgi:uncharacterized membrane protein|nr:hypothetical protein [Cyanobacteria bacterium SZAS LIN-5]